MISISTDNGGSFEYPHDLKDITLQKYIEFIDFVQFTKPQLLKDIDQVQVEARQAIDNNDNKLLDTLDAKLKDIVAKIDDVYLYTECHPYYARVVSFFSGLDIRYILGQDGGNGMDLNHLTWLYNHTVNIFNNLPEVEYSNIIEVNGEAWYLPERYMSNSTVIEFAESAQFQANLSKVEGGEWKALAKMMCVLVRKKDEQYSDKLLSREGIFLKWSLYDCWRVGFFLLKRLEALQPNLAIYTNVQTLRLLKQELKN